MTEGCEKSYPRSNWLAAVRFFVEDAIFRQIMIYAFVFLTSCPDFFFDLKENNSNLGLITYKSDYRKRWSSHVGRNELGKKERFSLSS